MPEIVFRLPNLAQMLNRITKDEHLFGSRHIANEMLHAVHFLSTTNVRVLLTVATVHQNRFPQSFEV